MTAVHTLHNCFNYQDTEKFWWTQIIYCPDVVTDAQGKYAASGNRAAGHLKQVLLLGTLVLSV
jgi:hypothetical protein